MDEITIPAITAVQSAEASAAQVSTVLKKVPFRPFRSHRPENESIVKPSLAANPPLESELAEVTRAFRAYRSTNSRVAVYIYLSKVFAIVMRWRHLGCAVNKSKAALRLQRNPPDMKAELFGIVTSCTADPEIIDAKTRSKWSRVLRYAARAKPSGQRLADFVKSNGGLNECARKFARLAH